MTIADGCTVKIHYRLFDEEGQMIDTSVGKNPLIYRHGANHIVPGLEKCLTGCAVGEELKIEIQPEDGYGFFDPDLISTMPLSAFNGLGPLKPGMCFETQRQAGEMVLITIQEVSDSGVTVNENHPLAGKVLFFEVMVVEIVSDPEEIKAHGECVSLKA